MKIGTKGPLGAVGTAASFMNVVKDIDFEEARRRAEQVPSILILATSGELAQNVADAMFGEEDRNGVLPRAWSDTQSDFHPERYDLILVATANANGLESEVHAAVSASGANTPIMSVAPKDYADAEGVEGFRHRSLELLPDLAPAMGRFHPTWRKAAVNAIVDQTSRANAQFALVSNIPAVVPIIGGLISASADLIVLTKNQLMMCYRIAAAHGEDLENHIAIIRELTPVVGASFLWRTAAREASTFIPFAAGTIPKVTIAYAGTLAMGKAADYYYRYGSKPSRKQLKRLQEEARALAANVPALRGLLPEPDTDPPDAADTTIVIERNGQHEAD